MTVYTNPEVFSPYTENTLTDEGRALAIEGINLIKNHGLCVIILAGGQGTRLGSDAPKGCYVLPKIQKSLFEIHCMGLKAAFEYYKCKAKILIMTSSYTHEATIKFFENARYFGLKSDHFLFFQQCNSTCIGLDNKPLPYFEGFATAPNGNGALFKSMKDQNAFNFISDCKYTVVVSVDNTLACIVDPAAVGYLHKRKLEVLFKSITRLENESVGVFVKLDQKLMVCEYSELGNSNDPHLNQGSTFSQGNICNQLFLTEFIEKIANLDLPEHKAFKKIPYTENGKIIKPTKNNGYKTEFFIFDCLEFTESAGVMNVPRELEFAPVKNAPGSKSDSPDTAVEALLARNQILSEGSGYEKNGIVFYNMIN